MKIKWYIVFHIIYAVLFFGPLYSIIKGTPGVLELIEWQKEEKKKDFGMYVEIGLRIIGIVFCVVFLLWNIPKRDIPLLQDLPYAIHGEVAEEEVIVIEYGKKTPFTWFNEEVILVAQREETGDHEEFIIWFECDQEKGEKLKKGDKIQISYLPHSHFGIILAVLENE